MASLADGTRREDHGGRFGPAGLVWRLTCRCRSKLYPLCLLMTIIALLLAVVALTGQGMEAALATSAGRLGADLMVIPAGAEVPLNATLIGGVPLKRLLPAGVEKSVASLPGVCQVAPQYFLSSAPATCCETGNLLLIGFDPARDFTVLPWLPQKLPLLRESDDLLVGGGVMKARGAELRLYNRSFRVAARLEKSGIGYFDNAVFIPLAGVSAMERSSRTGAMPLPVHWERPSLLLVQLSAGADPRTTAAAMERAIPDVRVLTIPELFHRERTKMAQLAAARRPLVLAGWLLALATGGAVQIFYWRDHRKTLGLLQVWGYGRRTLLPLFAGETFLLALLAMTVGSLAALLLVRYFAGYLTLSLGVPLLLGAGAASIAGIPWLCLSFAAGMAIETLLIILCLLRQEPAVLMRGA